MDIIKGILLLVASLVFVSPVDATVYQYFDEEGTLIVTDNPYGIKRARPRSDFKFNNINLNYRNDVSYDYYPVFGKNIQEALAYTNMNGPFDSIEKKNYAAQTKWNLGWSYKIDSSYRIEGPQVYVSLNLFDIELRSDIMVLLPMLAENMALNYHEQKLWENFMQGLLEHEHDHVKITKDALYWDDALKKISAIKELTLNYDPRSNLNAVIKDAVEAETLKIGHDLIMTLKARNDEYDRLTEHGLKPEMRPVFFSRQ